MPLAAGDRGTPGRGWRSSRTSVVSWLGGTSRPIRSARCGDVATHVGFRAARRAARVALRRRIGDAPADRGPVDARAAGGARDRESVGLPGSLRSAMPPRSITAKPDRPFQKEDRRREGVRSRTINGRVFANDIEVRDDYVAGGTAATVGPMVPRLLLGHGTIAQTRQLPLGCVPKKYAGRVSRRFFSISPCAR